MNLPLAFALARESYILIGKWILVKLHIRKMNVVDIAAYNDRRDYLLRRIREVRK